jgi:hypothetical protein
LYTLRAMRALRFIIIVFSLGRLAAAQAPRRLEIRVRVTDTAGTPIPDASVSVMRGSSALASGPTDELGRRSLSIERSDGDLEIVVRKIGFERNGRFVRPTASDTLALPFMLRRTVQTLETVSVKASEDVKRKAYHLDADDIANSTRPLFDGMDVVRKLRPDIVYGRFQGGFDPCVIHDIWVNGQHIRNPPVNDMAAARRPKPPPNISRPTGNLTAADKPHPPPPDPLSKVPLDVWSVLATIKPEHVAEMNYADCTDFTVDRPGGRNALFVVLKTGVDFQPGIGSFVIEERTAPTLPVYRMRILGVFDETTGEPIDSVEVIDVSSGSKAVTTSTGTVALTYVPDGGGSVRLHKPGYKDVTLDVVIAPAALTPITATMVPAKP